MQKAWLSGKSGRAVGVTGGTSYRQNWLSGEADLVDQSGSPGIYRTCKTPG